MRRRTRRALAVPAVTALLLSLAACGEDEGDAGQPTEGGLDTITVSGDFGAPPEIGWDGRVSVDELAAETLVEGDGAEVVEGGKVMAHLLIGNGYSESTALSTWDEAPQAPQIFDPAAELPAGILAGFEGTTVGSRTATLAPPADAFGEAGNPQLGIGNADSALFVMDVVGVVQPSVADDVREPPPGLPRIRTDADGAPTGLNFRGADEPGDELEVVMLAEGNGPRVEADDFVAVSYLGQTADGEQPFDTNFTAPEPDPANPAPPAPAGPGVFSLDGVVDGWKQGLEGIPTRSRVMLVIPPELGYGEQGNEQAGIDGDDTLYFVIDVLGTSTAEGVSTADAAAGGAGGGAGSGGGGTDQQ